MRDDYIFYTKIEYVDHREMIFPLGDLVPDICAGLSVRDIRAIACVSRDVHGMMAPFMEVQKGERCEHLSLCRILYIKSIWPRLHRVVKRQVAIYSDFFYTEASRLASDYTGVIIILRGMPPYRHYNKSYICVHNGMARYGIGTYRRTISYQHLGEYVYATRVPIPFAYFIDMFVTYMLLGDIGDGYIDREVKCESWVEMNGCEYIQKHKFILCEPFMEVLIQW